MPLLPRRRPPEPVAPVVEPVAPAEPDPPVRQRAITASAAKVSVPDKGPDSRRLNQQWQERAVAYYDQLGPIKDASQFYARALSKLRIFPALKDPDGEIEPFDNPKAAELLNRIQDPGGGRSTMFGTYGRLMFIIGECLLLGTVDDGIEHWEIVSRFELEKKDSDGSFVRRLGPGIEGKILKPMAPDADTLQEGECVVYRLWRRHPVWSGLADAPMRGALDDCEELVMLTNAVRRRARSRLAGPGILLIPEEISQAPLEPGPDEDAEEDIFLADLIEAGMAPIKDESDVAGLIPLLVRGPAEHIDKVTLLRFVDPNETYQEAKLRMECLQRIAISLDFEPEEMTGLANANHWTSHEVDDRRWTIHLQPVAQQLCDDLTTAYFRPAAKDAGIAEWERLVIGYDNAEIVQRPDRGKDAIEAHEHLVISDATLREALGFNDDNIPDEEELTRRIGIKIRSPELALGEEIPIAGEPPLDGPPDEPPTVTAAGTLDAGWLAGAATMTVERARELAGSRIRTRTKACGPCQTQINGVPNALVASVLGREQASEAGTDRDLVAGAADSLVGRLTRSGLSTETALQLGLLVEDHAAQTLYDPEPAPLELPPILDLVAA